MGPVPTVLITEHELIRDVFTRMNLFKKPKLNYLVEILFSGLVRYEGEKWAKHRKIVNPAFHMEKLKVSHFLTILLFTFSPFFLLACKCTLVILLIFISCYR